MRGVDQSISDPADLAVEGRPAALDKTGDAERQQDSTSQPPAWPAPQDGPDAAQRNSQSERQPGAKESVDALVSC